MFQKILKRFVTFLALASCNNESLGSIGTRIRTRESIHKSLDSDFGLETCWTRTRTRVLRIWTRTRTRDMRTRTRLGLVASLDIKD